MKINKIVILFLVFVAGIAVAAAFVYANEGKIKQLLGKEMSPQAAADNVIKYINENLLAEGNVASLISVSEKMGLYEITLKVGEQEFVSYVTKDGAMFYVSEGYKIKEEVAAKSDSP